MQTTLKFEPNKNQKKAIEKIDGPVMVLAGSRDRKNLYRNRTYQVYD